MHFSIASILMVATGAWIGAILFQSAVVAPAVFGVLDEPSARRYLRTLFPKFFRFGIGCGVLMVMALVAAGLTLGFVHPVSTMLVIAVIMTAMAGSALLLVPAINDARDLGASGEDRFRRLHRLSVLLTIGDLLLGVLLLVILARTFSGLMPVA